CFHAGPFSPEGAAALWDARADEIYEPLIAEAVRWGDRHRNPAARREAPWQTMLSTMHRSFFPRRTETLLTQLRARGLYPRLDAPDFEPHGATFPTPAAVTLRAPVG
ncbi:MAG: hypothetical protein GWO24_01005, partial [Akkermansiaceae bacterium]|nr:hypothetical protein [Akkermansiaceae bacterium]